MDRASCVNSREWGRELESGLFCIPSEEIHLDEVLGSWLVVFVLCSSCLFFLLWTLDSAAVQARSEQVGRVARGN